ncbi:MAG: histidine kinase dimerization/phospho-acceptor domain-containing protein [Candidatus Competibacteraceae bacterium]
MLAQNFNTMLHVIEQHQRIESKLHERSKAEQELYVAHLELHERHRQIEAAYQELTRTRDQLIHSEKMASLGLLMAGVAHELNNPISYVYSNLEFIEEYTESLIRSIEYNRFWS